MASRNKFASALQTVSSQLSAVLATGKLQLDDGHGIIASSRRSGTNEIADLKAQLMSQSKEKKKSAVKKVIASMTLGKDVSPLFTEVVNCIQTTNLELKKLVYLYLINFARVRPDLTMLAINTFHKDSQDQNPVIRALAIRTLGSIKLQSCVEYTIEPLRKLCGDDDAYVRKCAVISVGKVFDTDPKACVDNMLIQDLKNMLETETNQLVLVNILATLNEVQVSRRAAGDLEPVFKLETKVVQRLLATLSEAGEWGQVTVLDIIAEYYKPTNREREIIMDKLISRLTHNNTGVVLAAVRIILVFAEELRRSNYAATSPSGVVSKGDEILDCVLKRRIVPALVSSISAETPEVCYCILRNIRIIQSKYPKAFANEYRSFFIKFNDPPYIKFEKLELLTLCASALNNMGSENNDAITLIINELMEYANEVDEEFVRRSKRALGRAACMIPSICSMVLATLAKTLEICPDESIVVTADIVRRYPCTAGDNASIPAAVIQPLLTCKISSVKGRQSQVWLAGEYYSQLSRVALTLVQTYITSFSDEAQEVQTQILRSTATIAVQSGTREIFDNCMLALKKTESHESGYVRIADPILLDRAQFYKQLVEDSTGLGAEVLCKRKSPPISVDFFRLPDDLVDCLLNHIGKSASVLLDYPETFVANIKDKAAMRGTSVLDQLNEDEEQASFQKPRPSMVDTNHDDGPDDENDDDAITHPDESSPSQPRKAGSTTIDPLNRKDVSVADADPPVLYDIWGTKILGEIIRQNGSDRYLLLKVESSNLAPPLKMKIEPNSFGWDFENLRDITAVGNPGRYALSFGPNISGQPPVKPLTINVDIDEIGRIEIPYNLSQVLLERGPVSTELFKSHWARMGSEKQDKFFCVSHNEQPSDIPSAIERLRQQYVSLVTRTDGASYVTLFMSAVTINKLLLLLELSFQTNQPGICICGRADARAVTEIFTEEVKKILECRRV